MSTLANPHRLIALANWQPYFQKQIASLPMLEANSASA